MLGSWAQAPSTAAQGSMELACSLAPCSCIASVLCILLCSYLADYLVLQCFLFFRIYILGCLFGRVSTWSATQLYTSFCCLVESVYRSLYELGPLPGHSFWYILPGHSFWYTLTGHSFWHILCCRRERCGSAGKSRSLCSCCTSSHHPISLCCVLF